MRYTGFFIAVLSISFCSAQFTVTDLDLNYNNLELIEIYNQDQSDRKTQPIDWDAVSKRDRQREKRIYELLDSNKVRTSQDYHHAAMVFQHGGDSTAYGMAVKLMKRSVELDSTASKWLLAAAIDRYLLSKNEPQIYGTQYEKKGKGQPWELSPIDTTVISDAQRQEYNVPALAVQKERVRQMNLKKLATVYEEVTDIDSLISFIKFNKSDLEYDFSERAINSFGYRLQRIGKIEEALKIFELNTELYPNSYNTFDSYGECLLRLNHKEEGLKAYKKSLELNPKNENAKSVLEQNH